MKRLVRSTLANFILNNNQSTVFHGGVFLFAVKRPCLFTKSMAANKQGRLRSNKKGECGLMKSGYVVLTDYCDPYLEFYEGYSEAKKEFDRRTNNKNENSLNIHLCQMLESFTGEGNK